MAVVLLLCSHYPAEKKEQVTPHQKLRLTGFPETPGKCFEFSVICQVSSSCCWANLHRGVLKALLSPLCCPILWTGVGLVLWDELVMSGSLFPPGGDSDQLWMVWVFLVFEVVLGTKYCRYDCLSASFWKADVPCEQHWLLCKHSAVSDKNTVCFPLNKTTQLCPCCRQEHQTYQTSAVF